MISEEKIKQNVQDLGRKFESHYQDSENLLMVALLRGSAIFMSDLCRAVDLPMSIDFMTASSYGNSTESSRDLKIVQDLTESVEGRDVIIVEDIIDTGNTLSKVADMLKLRYPKSLTLCTLLDKPSRRGLGKY